MNLVVLYVAVLQAETMGRIDMLFLWILGRPKNLAAGELEPWGLSWVYSVWDMKLLFL